MLHSCRRDLGELIMIIDTESTIIINDHKSQKVLHSHSCALSMHDGRRQKMAVAVEHKAQSERRKYEGEERERERETMCT